MLLFRVQYKDERQEIEHSSGPIEFGRGGPRHNITRCVLNDGYVSKDHLRVVENDDGRILVENLSRRNSIRLADGDILAVGAQRDFETPVRLSVGETTIDIERPQADSDETSSAPFIPAFPPRISQPVYTTLRELGHSPSPETLAHWFETVIAVQRAAAGSLEFYQQTARAVVTLVGLDRGLVLLRRDGQWQVQARYPEADGPVGREFSRSTLQRVERERRTFFQKANMTPGATDSLPGVEAVAASPIFDSQDHVVGALYGCRNRITAHAGLGIGPLEAQVMQLLASAVGIGLARQEQEARAARRLVQLEQFFPGDLAREMERNPHVLDGQEREVTVLFSDIRGFSRIAERLDPSDICRLVSDVMEKLTTRVQEAGGVVVHYAGDGLMALWNAPKDVPDHAARACRAALAMHGDMPELDAQWQERLGAPVRLGIGLNTGPALCGNTGSKKKFHYGALGHAVNLASRVEGATKQLGIPIILTGSTLAQIGDDFATRRLCRVRVVGIDEAVELHELHSEHAPNGWQNWRAAYEKGLTQYESGDWVQACGTFHTLLLGRTEHDRPTLTLLARAAQALKEPPEHFDPVIDLDRK